MGKDRFEEEIASRFRGLKGEDARRAPAFERLANAAGRRAGRVPRRAPLWAGFAFAAATAAAVILVLGVVPRGRQRDAVDLEAWSSLSRWTASTDTFLVSSGPSWGGTSIATPSDTLMGAGPRSDGSLPNQKETL